MLNFIFACLQLKLACNKLVLHTHLLALQSHSRHQDVGDQGVDPKYEAKDLGVILENYITKPALNSAGVYSNL